MLIETIVCTVKITLIFILISSTLYCHSQDSIRSRPKKFNWIGYVGVHNIQTPELRSRLQTIGYLKPAATHFCFGLGLKYGKQRPFGGVDLSIFMLGHGQQSESKAFLVQGFFNYKIIDNKNFYMAPGVDIGLQKMKIDFRRIGPSPNFDSLFLFSGNTVKLKNQAPVAGFSTIFHFRKLDAAKSFFLKALAQVRMGYKFGFQKNNWDQDFVTILNAPTDRLNSFYIELLAGF
jgi:hypothetical protein